MDRQGELSIIRAAYAKQILAAADVVDNARLEAALSATRREDFLGAGPWWIFRRFRDYVTTPDADPVYLYTDDLVGILPERQLNNGQPSLHAHLIHRASPAAGEHVVHIGTGTGYYTAILAHLVGPSGRVTGIEYEPELAARAKANFAACPNVEIVEGDGALASFGEADIIYVNAGCTRPAESWLDRLADGGRLILPMTSDQGFGAKSLERMARAGAVFRIERRGKDYLAYWISPVAIFPCAGHRDEMSERALADAFAKEAGRRSHASIAIRRFPRRVAGFVDRDGASPTVRYQGFECPGSGWCSARRLRSMKPSPHPPLGKSRLRTTPSPSSRHFRQMAEGRGEFDVRSCNAVIDSSPVALSVGPKLRSLAIVTGHQPMQSLDLKPLLPLYLVIFVGFCGYSLMITLFVPMLMGADSFIGANTTPGQRSVVLGVLLAIYPLGQFLGSPVLGALSDRYGRKPVLTASLLVSIVAFVLISLGVEWRSIALLAVGCLIGGLAESNIAIAQSAISDVAGPDERPRLFAWIYSCCSLGYIAGPVAGGQLALHVGWSAPFWVVVPLLAMLLLWIKVSFRETHQPEENKRFDIFAALTNLVTVFTDRPIRQLYLINFLIYLGLFGYFRMVLVYMVDRWQTTVDQTTLIYSGLAMISAIASFGLMAPLTRRFGLNRVAISSALLAGMTMTLIPLPAELGSIWVTGGLTTLIGTLALAACPAILANAVSMERQGRVMGNNQALQVGAESLSAAIGGGLAGILIPLPLVAFGFLLIGAGLLLLFLPAVGPAPLPEAAKLS